MPEHNIDYSLQNIHSAAKEFLNITTPYRIFAFHGGMGAGKTTFIKEICRLMKCNETTGSPTFSIVNEYFATQTGKRIFHTDLFRLQNFDEVLNIGIEDYLNDAESINFIEWPELIEGLLPVDSVHLYFETVTDTERTIRIVTP
jgi:tRNA threonylcarbamoyladenosine biosynthesis protein TsaE